MIQHDWTWLDMIQHEYIMMIQHVENTIQPDSAWLIQIQHGSTLLKHDQTILARVLFRGLARGGEDYSQARLHWCYRRGTRPAPCAQRQRECHGDITGDGGEVTRQNFGMEHDGTWFWVTSQAFPKHFMRFMGLISWDSGFKQRTWWWKMVMFSPARFVFFFFVVYHMKI